MRISDLCAEAQIEVEKLIQEHLAREKEIEDEWWETHERKGYDSGAAPQLAALTKEYGDKIRTVCEKYKGGDTNVH